MPPILSRRLRPVATLGLLLFVLSLTGCASKTIQPSPPLSSPQACAASAPSSALCPVCPVCPALEAPKPAAKPFAAAHWEDLPNWPGNDGLAPAFDALIASCNSLQRQTQWQAPCAAARELTERDDTSLRHWFEAHLQPWQLVNPDSSREGLVTGYYEPILKASRTRKPPYLHPIYGVPEDMVIVDLAGLYPELKHMRLRGRIVGNKLVPYYSRGEWTQQEARRAADVLVWADDSLDVFFLQIQGSGQIQLDDGSRIRVNYANQNGHPYRSIGRWLIDQGELKLEQASMQGIRHWLKANPKRATELLNANPSYVYFRELPLTSAGPPGAMGIPLTAERSIAIDPRHTPLGAPVWLATTYPNSERVLTRLMVAQDTGGAIRGPVRADFFWGSGPEAGNLAGKMRQQGRMWTLLPAGHTPAALLK